MHNVKIKVYNEARVVLFMRMDRFSIEELVMDPQFVHKCCIFSILNDFDWIYINQQTKEISW
jgi:hypothetical protein